MCSTSSTSTENVLRTLLLEQANLLFLADLCYSHIASSMSIDLVLVCLHCAREKPLQVETVEDYIRSHCHVASLTICSTQGLNKALAYSLIR